MHKHTLSSTLLWGWQLFVGLSAEGSSSSRRIGRLRSGFLLFFVRWGVCLFGDIRVVELVKGVGRERGKSWGWTRSEAFVEDYRIDDEYCTSILPLLSICLDVLEKTSYRSHVGYRL